MKLLDYNEMGILKRGHGITVRRQVEGVAHVTHDDGTRAQYAIEHLRHIAMRPWTQRFREWISEVVA